MSVTEDRRKESTEDGEIEIRLSDIVQFLKESRRQMIIGALIGLVIGVLYAFSKPNVYTAQVTVMPEIQPKGAGLSGLGSLAGLAGLNLDNINAQDAIRPDLYPNILQSVSFALTVLKQPVFSEKFNAKMVFQKFIERVKEENFINKLIPEGQRDDNELKEHKNLSQEVRITKQQDALIKEIRSSISALHDKKTGILTITVVEPDPVVAAEVARLSLDYLTNYITTYRTEKARKQVSFLAKQVDEAKKRYQASEFAFSTYRDRNRGIFLNTAKIEEQRLQSDYLLTQSVYNDLSKQLEQAKIKVQEETPVIKLLEPPTVPIKKSGPKRTLTILGFIIVSVLITLVIGLIKRVFYLKLMR